MKQIDKLIRQFCPDPVFVIIDVRPGVAEVPTTAYESVAEVVFISYVSQLYRIQLIILKYALPYYHICFIRGVQVQGGGKEIERVFKHISCRIEAEEAEGVRL